MRALLFDDFESDRGVGFDELARDISDILGARRALRVELPGVLNWGLPSMSGLTPASEADRQQIANYITAALEQSEPRLEQIKVMTTESNIDFTFQLDARLIEPDDESITLRILSPHRGGGLGAEVAIIGKGYSGLQTHHRE